MTQKTGFASMKKVYVFLQTCQIDVFPSLVVTHGLLRFLRDLVLVSLTCKVSAVSPVVESCKTNRSRSQI